MASTLIETVNINLDEFSESFLTCATCLCTYDQERRRAKLLPCSHTVCLRCLERMSQIEQAVESGLLKCPMCREMAQIPPSGGVAAFPSSFLHNQLLDLMQRQRRDVVPNCSVHQQEQLLYCESCDLVFCELCDSPKTRSCAEHTVVPFSVAIKRLSEIVVFKAKQCVASLNTAAANVDCETVQLDKNVDRIVEELNASFQEVNQLVENRRRELLDSVRMMRDQKRKVLKDQMEMIDAHRKRLERELESCQVDVREIGARTRRVMAATEEALTLTDPRENAFLKLHTQPKKLLKEMGHSLSQFGAITGSTTFPSQCTLTQHDPASTYTQTQLLLRTFDVSGKPRTSGGDPIKVEITTRRRSPPPPQLPPTSSNHEQHRRRNPSDRDQSNRCSLNQDPNHADYSNSQDRDPVRVRDRTGHDRSHDQSNHQPPLSGGSIRPAQAQVPDPPDQRRTNNTSSRRPPSDSLSNSSASTPPPPATFTQSHLHQTITSCSTASINTNIISTTNHTDSNHDSSNHSNISHERSRWINSATSSVSATINDNDDGTYTISFIAYEAGEYDVHVTIFGRPIKNSPYTVVVSGHHAPRWQFGSFGLGELQLKQPVKIVQDHKGFSYILDTGNNRIKMLDGNGEYLDDIHSEALKDASTVGMTILPSGDILTLNWRTKEITKCTHNGETLQVMSFSEFMEPIDITVDSRSRILIADTGCAKIFVFDASFRPLFSFDVGAHCDSAPVTCVCIGLNDEILVGTCSSLLLFDPGGRFLRDISVSASSSTLHPASFPPSHRSRFRVTACAVCQSTGDIISAVIDAKTNRAHLAVSQYKGSFVFALDSYGSRLRCPCGVRVGTHRWTGMCLVVDSATHSVKAYQFR